ncbi:hypothetical protein [Streptomyces cyaneofuscatus]|uniref:hypothetical protein n=1 Tax=Streptomyces cyaneofuscatus TaxID=66883 RepID=UPI0037FA3892
MLGGFVERAVGAAEDNPAPGDRVTLGLSHSASGAATGLPERSSTAAFAGALLSAVSVTRCSAYGTTAPENLPGNGHSLPGAPFSRSARQYTLAFPSADVATVTPASP